MFVKCTEERFNKLCATPGTHIFFKHSPTCGVSTQAYRSLEVCMKTYYEPIYLIDVHSQQDLKHHIADTLGIRHESPQVILLKHGLVEAVLNHRYITSSTIQSLLHL